MRLILVFAIALPVLASCAEPEVFVLKNTRTGEVRECHGDEHSFALFPIAQNMANNRTAESCAKGYEAAGWQRMSR
jgi:hypothetical protein